MADLAIIGLGGVGQALAQLVDGVFTVNLVADSSGFMSGSLDLQSIVESKVAGKRLVDLPHAVAGNWIDALSPNTLIADTTAHDTGELLLTAVQLAHRVALANKKPLAGPYNQFRHLLEHDMTRHEATVGAGLPVVVTTMMLRDTRDEVYQIEGCLSGTLGFVMSEIQAGRSFSQTVRTARDRGWTEPDPRDDLGGVDVARKGLILARVLGYQFELSDVEIEPLYPTELAAGSVADFMQAIPSLDQQFAERQSEAAQKDQTLRYVATVTPESIKVGLREVPLASPLGSLQGPDNMVTWTTRNYRDNPLVVRGPGAGVEVTAAAVLFDLLTHKAQM